MEIFEQLYENYIDGVFLGCVKEYISISQNTSFCHEKWMNQCVSFEYNST